MIQLGYFIQIQSMSKNNTGLNEVIDKLMKITKNSSLTYINDFPIKFYKTKNR